ncbi:hypothetical protein [Tardiphaga sp. 813_E8_N1_3]|uniref:hypothetical protein n=1 Tax=Tardiphaga sp. 813_E8_N1_3 TaxID=3240760 RepID=UPI003F1E7A99
MSVVKLMVLVIIAARSTADGITMKDVGVQKRKAITGRSEPELTLAPQSGNAPDPRLVEFVRLLARHAARRWYEQADKEQGLNRSRLYRKRYHEGRALPYLGGGQG